MSQAATPTTARVEQAQERTPVGGRTLAGRLARKEIGAIALVAAPAIALVAMFYRWFLQQHAMSARALEDWGHAYIVPAVCGFYIWKKRDEILRTPQGVYWPGLAVALLGVVTYLYFVLSFPNHMFQGFALVLTVSGLVMLMGGTKVFGLLFFAVAYLALGVTISEQVMNALTWPLKQFAAVGGHLLLQMMQVDAVRPPGGNVITVYGSGGTEVPLNVEEACSGMRMVIAFIALGAAVAFLSCRFWWQRIALMMLTIPVALGMNIVRIGALGVAGLIDPELASGDAHAVIGMILLFPSLALFMGCVWLLNRAVVEEIGRASCRERV
jgi:exosortase